MLAEYPTMEDSLFPSQMDFIVLPVKLGGYCIAQAWDNLLIMHYCCSRYRRPRWNGSFWSCKGCERKLVQPSSNAISNEIRLENHTGSSVRDWVSVWLDVPKDAVEVDIKWDGEVA